MVAAKLPDLSGSVLSETIGASLKVIDLGSGDCLQETVPQHSDL
jgi:hypothetical protein